VPSVSPLIYIRQAISEGRSANSAYRAMREDVKRLSEQSGKLWHGIGRSTFLSLYSETVAARSKVANALDYPVDQLPDASVMGERESRFSRGYITWLTVYSRQHGEREVEAEFFAVHSKTPITPAEAMAKAQEGFETNAQQQHGTRAGYSFIGATYSGTWRMVPRKQ
jgi:hypothetical protein